MSDTSIKKITIQRENTSETYDLGAEALNVDVSYDSNGDIIEDIDATGVVVANTQSLAKEIKDIEDELSNKIDETDISSKADLINGKIKLDQFPSYAEGVLEGYYNDENHKFYKDNLFTEEISGESNKLYVDKNTNFIYRWESNQFIKIIKDFSGLDIYDLSDVDIDNPTNGESLVYNGAEGKWSNKGAELHIVTIPTVTGEIFTYNGSAQGPVIDNLDPDFDIYVTTSGDLQATNASDNLYQFTYTLKNTSLSCWSDGTTNSKTYSYRINKANGSIVLASNNITLDDDHKVVSVNVTSHTGTVSASSSATGIATVTATDSAVTITATEETGTATITVIAAANTNYTAASDTINVSAEFIIATLQLDPTKSNYITKVEVYDGDTLIDMYTDSISSTMIPVAPGNKIKLYGNPNGSWYYTSVESITTQLPVYETCYFTVPNDANGDAVLYIMVSDNPSSPAANIVYCDNTYIPNSTTTGWVKSESCYPILDTDIPHGNDEYVKANNVENFINNYSSGQVGFQGNGNGKIYVKAGTFNSGEQSDPSIASSGILIYDAGSGNPKGTALENYKCAAHLANVMNYILYNTKGISYGSNVALFTNTPTTVTSSGVFTELDSSIIPKGFYDASCIGEDLPFRCGGQGQFGYYQSRFVGSNHNRAVWW